MARQAAIQSMQMDRKVTFQRLTPVRDPDTGAIQDVWTDAFAAWAKMTQLLSVRSPDEMVRSGVESYQRMTFLWIHYRTDVDTAMRVITSDGAILQVTAVAEIERRRWLKVGAKEWSHE